MENTQHTHNASISSRNQSSSTRPQTSAKSSHVAQFENEGGVSAVAPPPMADKATQKQGSAKSLGSVLSGSLTPEAQEGLDRVFSEVSSYFGKSKSYINANPKEAAVLAATIGMAAWALMFTKPGRQIFDKGAAVAGPKFSEWLSATFAAPQKQS